MKNKGYSYYYRLECFGGYQNNQTYESKTLGGLLKKFKGYSSRPKGRLISDFIKMYDSGSTDAYYRIHCVFVYPNGMEKIIYTCEGLK